MNENEDGIALRHLQSARADFERDGIAGPFQVFDSGEARALIARLRQAPPAVEWFKGRAAGSALWFEIATTPRILDTVRAVIGNDVILWGASLVTRVHGQKHHWHTDIETSEQLPGTAAVWIGLRNTSRESSLMLIRRSQKFGMTVQERARSAGMARENVLHQHVALWAGEIDRESELVQFEMGDGDAVLFDGRTWHGSHNERPDEPRVALLLQYAIPSRPIRMADLTTLEFPFRFLEAPKPPCVLVSGTDAYNVNRMVDPPQSDSE